MRNKTYEMYLNRERLRRASDLRLFVWTIKMMIVKDASWFESKPSDKLIFILIKITLVSFDFE